MFQEFINRTGIKIPPLNGLERRSADFVVKYARKFPELFFVFVLAARTYRLRTAAEFAQESGRHASAVSTNHADPRNRRSPPYKLCATHLRKRVPELSTSRRARLGLCVPLILGVMGKIMMEAAPSVAREYNIPREVVDAAYRKNPVHRKRVYKASTKLYGLCEELGLTNRWSLRLWRAMNILPEAGAFSSATTQA